MNWQPAAPTRTAAAKTRHPGERRLSVDTLAIRHRPAAVASICARVRHFKKTRLYDGRVGGAAGGVRPDARGRPRGARTRRACVQALGKPTVGLMIGGRLVLGVVPLAMLPHAGASQTTAGSAGPPKVVLIDLPIPDYPPIARSALVSGDVYVTVNVRPDGTVAAATATRF